MKTNNINAYASNVSNAKTSSFAWSAINSQFGDHSEFRNKMEELRSPKRVKKLIKLHVNALTQTEAMAKFNDVLGAAKSVHTKRRDEAVEALVGVNMDMVTLPEPIENDACEADIAQHKMDWNVWTLSEVVRLAEISIVVIEDFENKGRKLLKDVLSGIVSAYSKGKRDNAIVTAILPGVVRAYGYAGHDKLDYAMSIIDLVKSAGFIKMSKVKTKEGHIEFVFTLNDMSDIRKAVSQTSKRSLKLFKPEPVTGNISIRSKYDYVQEVDAVADVIDSLNGVSVSFKDTVTESDIVELARYAVQDEDGSCLFDESWKQAIKSDMLDEFNVVKSSGNKFFIERNTDGVGRMYESSKFGFHMGHAHKEVLELTNKEALNEDGKWAMRQMFAEVEGFRPDGKKPTEAQAEEFFYANCSSMPGTKEGREILDIYYSNKPTGYLVEVDAQTQGPSLFGLMTGDGQLAYHCGVIGSTERTDMYSLLAKAMNSRLSVAAWTRSNSKSSLMTKGYGAGYNTIMFGSKGSNNMELGEYVVKAGSKKQNPLMETANSIGITDTKSVWVAFKKTMQKIAPAMLETQAMLSNIQKGLGLAVLAWTMPDGIVATVATQHTVEKHAKWMSGDGKLHSMLHHERELDATNVTALAPRVIQSVDAYIGRYVARDLNAKGIELVFIHDGYMTHPNYIKELQASYRRALAHVYSIDLLTDIISQLIGTPVSSLLKDSDFTVRDILTSRYSLWF